jgi:hypothetical protein
LFLFAWMLGVQQWADRGTRLKKGTHHFIIVVMKKQYYYEHYFGATALLQS